MAINDTFSIQEINMDKKSFSYDIELKEIEAYWNNEYAVHPSNNHCKIFYDLNLTFQVFLRLIFT